MARTALPIVIIGGGLAGLALAQGLKKSSIAFHVYERDASISARPQGYRIRISAEGASALENLLPEHHFKEFEDTCGKLIEGGNIVDALTGERGDWVGPSPPKHMPGKAYNADRVILRAVLMEGLENYVSFGKKFERYEIAPDHVIVWFDDGTNVKGRMVIGADGIRSAVRKQMLPNMVTLDTEGRAVFGKTALTPEISAQIPKEVGNGICLISEPREVESPIKLFTDGMAFNRSYDGFLQLPPDYIYWVLVFRQDRAGMPTRDLLSLSRSQSVEKAVELTRDWHPTCQTIISEQDPSASSSLAFMTTDPDIAPWEPNSHVTILGDAAHPMPPVGGVGANAAFQDAVALYAALCDDGSRDKIGQYEDSMRTRVKTILEMSAGAGARFFGMKPLEELKPENIWD